MHDPSYEDIHKMHNLHCDMQQRKRTVQTVLHNELEKKNDFNFTANVCFLFIGTDGAFCLNTSL